MLGGKDGGAEVMGAGLLLEARTGNNALLVRTNRHTLTTPIAFSISMA